MRLHIYKWLSLCVGVWMVLVKVKKLEQVFSVVTTDILLSWKVELTTAVMMLMRCNA